MKFQVSTGYGLAELRALYRACEGKNRNHNGVWRSASAAGSKAASEFAREAGHRFRRRCRWHHRHAAPEERAAVQPGPGSAREWHQALPANARLSVDTLTFSPSLIKRGTRISRPVSRSEEHTSELQSPMYLVC